MLKKCLNMKVLAGLAVVGVGIWLLAPELVTAAVPLLLLAACPLSMVLMMAMMGKGNTQQGDAASAGQPQPDSRAALEARLRTLETEQAALKDELRTRAGKMARK